MKYYYAPAFPLSSLSLSLSLFFCFFLSLSVSFSLSLFHSHLLFLFICLSLSLGLPLALPLSVSLSLSLFLFCCLSVSLSLSLSFWLSSRRHAFLPNFLHSCGCPRRPCPTRKRVPNQHVCHARKQGKVGACHPICNRPCESAELATQNSHRIRALNALQPQIVSASRQPLIDWPVPRP